MEKKYPKEVLDKIPKGLYCHGDFVVNKKNPSVYSTPYMCPFWFSVEGKGKQENGYCVLLGKGDWDLNSEVQWVPLKGGKEGKFQSAKEIRLPMSLLWDQCKECGLKEEEE